MKRTHEKEPPPFLKEHWRWTGVKEKKTVLWFGKSKFEINFEHQDKDGRDCLAPLMLIHSGVGVNLCCNLDNNFFKEGLAYFRRTVPDSSLCILQQHVSIFKVWMSVHPGSTVVRTDSPCTEVTVLQLVAVLTPSLWPFVASLPWFHFCLTV